jgi:hypothetical protein
MSWHTGVENGADYVLAIPLEIYRFAESARYHFAKELVLHAVVQENRTPFNV